jgi:hypothetical protein
MESNCKELADSGYAFETMLSNCVLSFCLDAKRNKKIKDNPIRSACLSGQRTGLLAVTNFLPGVGYSHHLEALSVMLPLLQTRVEVRPKKLSWSGWFEAKTKNPLSGASFL